MCCHVSVITILVLAPGIPLSLSLSLCQKNVRTQNTSTYNFKNNVSFRGGINNFKNCHWYNNTRGTGNSVGIATGYGLDGPGIESQWGARYFAHVQTGPGAHSVSCTVGTGSFPGIKWPGRGADHPHPPSVEVENE
jgi:hypothetical protein